MWCYCSTSQKAFPCFSNCLFYPNHAMLFLSLTHTHFLSTSAVISHDQSLNTHHLPWLSPDHAPDPASEQTVKLTNAITQSVHSTQIKPQEDKSLFIFRSRHSYLGSEISCYASGSERAEVKVCPHLFICNSNWWKTSKFQCSYQNNKQLNI